MLSREEKDEIEDNYYSIQENIIEAAESSGRNPDEIKLVAISKGQSLNKINYVRELGVHAIGESRVQELRDKEEKQPEEIDWHFVGHLQRNKVKYLARMDNCHLIHSLDSLRLAKEIEKRAAKNKRDMSVLIQINVARDENKFGFMPEDLMPFLEKAEQFDNLSFEGLMTLVPHYDDSEKARYDFKKLADLRRQAEEKGFEMPELSMGMTNDYKVAIEEGATMIRLGRELFGERKY